MLDSFNRDIRYLRISITDRCNQRCVYCMPPEGTPLTRHEDILSFEEIADVVRRSVELGFNKVRLTGGEPLMRQDVITLVSMLASIDGIEDYGMTTNGTLLCEYARSLKNAGLHRLNISLDAIDPDSYRQITRGGDVAAVLEGIATAEEVGFTNIKINCVIGRDVDEPNAADVARFACKHGYSVRFIRKMDMFSGQFWKVPGGDGGDCPICNRLRLSSDGWIYPCLFSSERFSIRKLGVRDALTRSIQLKPESGRPGSLKTFCALGG